MLDLHREGWLRVARFRRVDGLDSRGREGDQGFLPQEDFPGKVRY